MLYNDFVSFTVPLVACHNGSVRYLGMAMGRRTQYRRKTCTTMDHSCIFIYIYAVWMGGAGGGLRMGMGMGMVANG